MTVRALFKICGGKRTLSEAILGHAPDRFTSYVEPFVGGGSVFFALARAGRLVGKKVFLSDVDPDIAALFVAVRDRARFVAAELAEFAAKHARARDPDRFFLSRRAEWNDGDRSPGRHLYLRAAGFNGVWRKNRAGLLNVPSSRSRRIVSIEQADMMAAAELLRGVSIEAADFRDVEMRRPGGLVYLDPPYDNKPGSIGFVGYTAGGFVEADQIDLIVQARQATEAGAVVLYSNAETARVRGWVRAGWPGAAVHVLTKRRTVASRSDQRGRVEELLVVGQPSRARASSARGR